MQNNKFTTGILHLVILVLGIIIGRYLIPHQERVVVDYNQGKQIQQQRQDTDNKNNNDTERDTFSQNDEQFLSNGGNENSDEGDTGNTSDNEKGTMIVRVPKIGEGGTTAFDPVEVKKSPAVLNAVYRALFKIQSGDGSRVWNGLQFDSVSIDSGVAKVELSGSWLPGGDMSGYRFRRLIDAAAFQYPNVDRVVVFLNGNAFDWCIDDVSGGENGCPTHPRYWDDDRSYYANNLVITY